ncbi:DUF1934 domain-containing protein [Clostridium sp. YIM B02515]|uniref:DUF1934 domain-containing protein n=1 Tax=Clostridium rhizosphaerae TaxID=2803861 RepID=A0ABS1T900_9CLOT|nr:DUF1934 domain-containing protein [Clostridium rhizosphaerae]MBL4935807.1 DUF1934 domain-containing protein [Clostridium rhizosphaerae]
MRKKAIISVTSKQTDSDESAIEVVTPGEFYKEDNFYYAVYNETELSGMEGTTTTLKVMPDSLLLSREGTTATEMRFKKYAKDLILYNTPYGVMEMKIETKDLTVNLDENGGDVAINYNLTIAGQNPQNTILKVNIKA